jgi:hypothetical protein
MLASIVHGVGSNLLCLAKCNVPVTLSQFDLHFLYPHRHERILRLTPPAALLVIPQHGAFSCKIHLNIHRRRLQSAVGLIPFRECLPPESVRVEHCDRTGLRGIPHMLLKEEAKRQCLGDIASAACIDIFDACWTSFSVLWPCASL